MTIAVELNPSSALALNGIALPYFFLGHTDEALEALAKAEVYDPLGDFVHHWMKAWALWQDHQCEEALLSLNNIAELPTETYKLLAVINVCRGDTEAANEAILYFTSRYPDWSIAEETNLHASVWIHTESIDRWLSELGAAGLPPS